MVRLLVNGSTTGWFRFVGGGLAAIILLVVASSVDAREPLKKVPGNGRGYITVEGHLSIFTDLADRALLTGTYGYGLRGGLRWARWGVFAMAEHNMWVATEYQLKPTFGAVNLGVGCEYLFVGGRVRSLFAIGPSILAADTVIDKAGTTGVFFDIRPLGVRWPFNKHTVVGLDPLSVSVVAPVLDGIPLIQVEYRTEVYLEFLF